MSDRLVTEPDLVEAIASRVVELLEERGAGQAFSPPPLVTATELARRFGLSRHYIYEHASELGAVRLGGRDAPALALRPGARLTRPRGAGGHGDRHSPAPSGPATRTGEGRPAPDREGRMSIQRHAIGRAPERPAAHQTCNAPACPTRGAPALPGRWVCSPCAERLSRRAHELWLDRAVRSTANNRRRT